MNKYILIIIGVAVIAVGAYAISRPDKDNNSKWGENNNVVENNGDVSNEGEVNNGEVISNTELVDGNYQINSEESKVYWQAEKVLAEHTGEVNVKSGEFTIENETLVSGNIVIDMTTIITDENIEMLETHLKSDDFFNINTYPEASLEITNLEVGNNPGEYNARGNLTIKDTTEEISFPVVVTMINETPQIISTFTIDRTVWDINFRSGKFFQDLGNNLIKDDINFSVMVRGE